MGLFKALAKADIAEGVGKRVVVEGQAILITNIEGAFFAVSDQCSHHGGSLSKGVFQDGVIACPRHGVKFNAKTGKVVSNLDHSSMKLSAKDLRCYTIYIEGDDIFIDIE